VGLQIINLLQMNITQLKKIAKGAAIAGGGASLTYLLSVLPGIDFGQYTAIATAALSILINITLKLLEKQQA
jgi:hypothetical protein